jgi:hypothetical protein
MRQLLPATLQRRQQQKSAEFNGVYCVTATAPRYLDRRSPLIRRPTRTDALLEGSALASSKYQKEDYSRYHIDHTYNQHASSEAATNNDLILCKRSHKHAEADYEECCHSFPQVGAE